MLKIPRLLIVAGAMKAGTSFLYDLLRENTHIETVPIKEINYFPHIHTDYYNITHGLRLHHLKAYSAHCEIGRSVQQIQKDVTFFSRYLTDPVDDKWFKSLYQSGNRIFKAEFSNIIALLDIKSLRHIRKLARRVKIVYIVRDPLSRLWSHTKFHNSFDWREDKKKKLDELTSAQFTTLLNETGHDCHGQYASNIRRLQEVFGEDAVKVLFYEDLTTNAASILCEVCAFIGIRAHNPDAERLVTPINVGPIMEMPTAFVEAARSLVLREFDALPAIGIEPHAEWRPI